MNRFMKRIILLLLCQSFLCQTFSQEKKNTCDRKSLEGFWQYPDAPQSFMLIQSDKAGEKLGETDMLIQYDIHWKDGCNHDLIVTKVVIGKNTPKAILPYLSLYKIGDVVEIPVLEVTDKYFKYNSTFKGKTYKNMCLERIPKELYETPPNVL